MHGVRIIFVQLSVTTLMMSNCDAQTIPECEKSLENGKKPTCKDLNEAKSCLQRLLDRGIDPLGLVSQELNILDSMKCSSCHGQFFVLWLILLPVAVLLKNIN